jgi:hypothetical protein
MAIIIEAPNEIYSVGNNRNKKLFAAGGITNCPDWQSEFIGLLSGYSNLTIFNPRRKNFPINDPLAAEEQIVWEYNRLLESDIISFWFSGGSLNPIVLYELGKWGNSTNKKVFIGCDSNYQRKQDVIIQTALARPEIVVADNIQQLASQIIQVIISDMMNRK